MHLMTALVRNLKKRTAKHKKTLLIMKLTAIILLSACLTASATGHTQRVSINMKNAPIQKVFKELVKQTGVSIICNAALLDGAKPVTIKLSNATVEEVIGKCLEGLPLSYTVEGGTIIIKKNQEPYHYQQNKTNRDNNLNFHYFTFTKLQFTKYTLLKTFV